MLDESADFVPELRSKAPAEIAGLGSFQVVELPLAG
jgi:hypothetical protein